MTSMFDQQASQGTKPISSALKPTPLTSSGYVNMQLREDVPIFSKQRIDFNPSDDITHVGVASGYLVIAMANSKLFRIDLKNPTAYDEISISKYTQANSKLSGVFVDPLGYHVILSFTMKQSDPAYNPELLYIHRKSDKLKSVTKSKNYEVTQVGWNFENTSESTTGPILLGTSKGLILETEISQNGEKMFQSGGIEQYWKQVFDVGKGEQIPITGIEFHRVANTNKYFIFVATPKRLYQFNGVTNLEERPLLQSIFNTYLNKPETPFGEASTSLNYSKLQFFFDKTKKIPTQFGWLTELGVYHGNLQTSYQEISNISDTKKHPPLSYPPFSRPPPIKKIPEPTNPPKPTNPANPAQPMNLANPTKPATQEIKKKVEVEKMDTPLAFVLTEFHTLLLYEDHVKAVSLLNEQLVYEEYFDSFGKLINIVKDPIKNTAWVITDKAVFRYKVSKEERNVWQIYADKNEFSLAKKYCENNPAHIDIINVKQAEMLFNKGEYEVSARIFADTQSTFESICLKFLESEKIDALKVYLERKLETQGKQDQIQITMLVIWIIELYLWQINELKIKENAVSTRYEMLQAEFKLFLKLPKVSECIQRNKSVIYDLMASHGDKENLIQLTVINKDFENVIRQNIYKKSYMQALAVLKEQGKRDLFYQFTPILMQEIPQPTVTALIEQGKKLNPSKLLPALISCDPDNAHVKEMVRYLEFCVKSMDCNDQAIHNYLVSLYTTYDPEALMRYLASQGQSMINYDKHYALRLCREKNLTKACVQLSSMLGLWESAIELALTDDVELAKKVADMPEDAKLRKKLWLKIVESHKDEMELKQAMEFLQQCDLIKIEDILPYFSDFVTIDHFKEPICNSLQEYNQKMEDLREDMEDATKSADQVRAEIQSFRNRCTVINVAEVCVLCQITLLLRPFYLFPCGHKFHSDCLLAELQPMLGPAKKNKLADLNRQLNSHFHTSETNNGFLGGLTTKEQIRNEIDSILASECLYCGEHMILAIDTPFITDSDWDRVMKDWE